MVLEIIMLTNMRCSICDSDKNVDLYEYDDLPNMENYYCISCIIAWENDREQELREEEELYKYEED